MAICVECEYFIHPTNADANLEFLGPMRCRNLDLPMTEFIFGYRDCKTLNPKGDCKGFKLQSEPDSIYELKGDEELAKTE